MAIATKNIKQGIYKIINLITGDFYIGSSIHLYNREKDHFHQLKHGTHGNSHLQRAYNKYGEENFSFEVFEYFKFPINYDKKLKSEHLVSRELYYINTLKPSYNIATTTDQCSFKLPCSVNTRLLRKENYKKNINLHNNRCLTPHLGCKHTLEDRINISKGKRESNKGLYIGMYNTENILLKRFVLASQATEITGIKRSAIANNLCGLSKSCKTPQGQRVIFKKLINL